MRIYKNSPGYNFANVNDELTKTPVKNHKRCAMFHITIPPAITYQWAATKAIHDTLKMVFLLEVLISCAQNVTEFFYKNIPIMWL